MLPVSRELMLSEIRSTRTILEKWEKIVDPECEGQGLPVLDIQGSMDNLHECLIEMQAELVIAAGKCENLAEAIHNKLR